MDREVSMIKSDDVLFSGRFTFIETSSPRKKGDIARLASKVLSATKGSCMTFFYHMYANDTRRMGSFNVYLKKQGDQGNGRLLFSRSGDQGNKWRKEWLFLLSDKPFQVAIF